VIVMAFNEAAGIEGVVREIRGALDRIGRPSEIVIVDDGSADPTAEVAERLVKDVPGVRVVRHLENQGLGGVYRTGFREAAHDLVTFFPADGQFPASIIEQFVPLAADCDLVLGFLPDRGGSLAALLSQAERLLYRLMFGAFPRFQGIMLFRREILDRIQLTSAGRGWGVVMELIVRASRGGFRIRSEPTCWRPRAQGRSRVLNPRTIWSNFRQAVALLRRL
jgi:glycosyltransferase involved in cell wall biosynthesis